MAYSSILGGEVAPQEPSGREAERLGPSNNSDSGSDTIGTAEARDGTNDSTQTGDRGAVAGRDAEIGADIRPDRVVNLADGEVAETDGLEVTDLDADELRALAEDDSADEDR